VNSQIKYFLNIKYPQDISLKIKIILFYFISVLLIFTFFRLLLLIAYPSVFSTISFFDKTMSFIHGLRFDFATTCSFLGGGGYNFILPIS
jgi:hypothetical protein